MIKFISQYNQDLTHTSTSLLNPLVEITISSDSTLEEVLQAFEYFLKATGYSFNGTVDIVDETSCEDVKVEEN